MNIFFGLPIPPSKSDVLTNMVLQQHPHWQKHHSIRWTPDINCHLTIHFFGEIKPELLTELSQNLIHYLSKIVNFSIKITKLYNFPKPNSDLVAAYVYLNQPLAHLYHQLQRAVEDYGFVPESRVFAPHITLCRAKKHILKMEPIIVPDFSIQIEELVLYQTQPGAHGSQYIPLQKWLF